MRVTTRKSVLCSAIALPVWSVALVLSFWPAAIGTAWHALHGNFTEYHGWRVEVPSGFYAFESKGNLLLLRARAQFGSGAEPGAHISIGYYSNGTHAFTCATDCEKVRGMYSRATTDGYLFARQVDTSAAGSPAYCFEKRREGKIAYYQVYCLAEGTVLMGQYDGPDRFLQAFYTTFSGLTRISAVRPGA